MDYCWVFAKKFDRNGHITRQKAYLVGKGYSQCFRINFLWISVAVIYFETIYTALALAAILHSAGDTSNAVFDAVGKALQAITDSLSASGIVDGLTYTATRGADQATCSARDAADCGAELEDVSGWWRGLTID